MYYVGYKTILLPDIQIFTYVLCRHVGKGMNKKKNIIQVIFTKKQYFSNKFKKFSQ